MSDDSDDWDADPELRDRLRSADPASSLHPADPAWTARLLEDTMSSPTDTPTEHEVLTESRETGTRRRGPLTWVVAAAAVLLIAGVGIFGLLNHDTQHDAVPAAGGSTTVTRLQAPAPAAYQARCMVPTAPMIAQQEVAFAGTVESISGDVVTLRPTHFYHGSPTDRVQVQAPQAADLQALIQAVHFKQGERYLVSATGGDVTICGFSAPWSQELAGVYAQAFPARH